MGYAIVKKLGSEMHGASFYLTSRSLESAEKAVEKLRSEVLQHISHFTGA
jgi:hypothetical protein